MAERRTRGRPSTIETLPDDVKQVIDQRLRTKGVTQRDILGEINRLLDEAGVDQQVSRSSLNRYATRMETVGGRIREGREIAEVWTARLGDKPTGDVSQLLIEMLRSMAFDLTLQMADDAEAVSPELIKDLALGVQRLERAAELSTKREREIRTAFAAEAAQATEKTLARTGMSRDTIDSIKADILGIA